MVFADVNCMIGEWTYKALRFAKPDELMSEMRRLGISKAMVFHSRSWLLDIKTGNDTIVDIVKPDSDTLIPVIALTPLIDQEFGGKEALTGFMKKNRVGAVRLFPMDHNYLLNPWNVDKLFSLLEELKIPVLIEGRGLGGGIDEYFPHIHDLAGRYKNLDIIMLTVGYRGLRIIYQLLDKHSNIHLDTSTFITYRGIEDVVRNFGAERILFGSRMPFIDGGVSVGRIIYADISDTDKEKIAGGNLFNMLENNKCLYSATGGVRQ